MSFLTKLFREISKSFRSSNQKKLEVIPNKYSTQPNIQLTRESEIPFRARTEKEKALEERVWKAQLQHRSSVLKERFAAQKEWMVIYEREGGIKRTSVKRG